MAAHLENPYNAWIMAKDIYAIVAARVREERHRAGLTMEQLAGSAGISPSFLAYIETKGSKPSLKTIEKLAEALRVPVADLFKDIPRPKRDPIDDAARKFSQLIKDSDPKARSAILDVVRTLTKSSKKADRAR